MGNQYDDASEWMNRKLKRLQGRVDNYGHEIDRRISNIERKVPGTRARAPVREPAVPEYRAPLPPSYDDPPVYVLEPLSPRGWVPQGRRAHYGPDRYLVPKLLATFLVVGGAFALLGKDIPTVPGLLQYGAIILVGCIGVSILYVAVAVRNGGFVGSNETTEAMMADASPAEERPTIIEREVIRVPCKYCTNLVDPMQRCPNCGGSPV